MRSQSACCWWCFVIVVGRNVCICLHDRYTKPGRVHWEKEWVAVTAQKKRVANQRVNTRERACNNFWCVEKLRMAVGNKPNWVVDTLLSLRDSLSLSCILIRLLFSAHNTDGERAWAELKCECWAHGHFGWCAFYARIISFCSAIILHLQFPHSHFISLSLLLSFCGCLFADRAGLMSRRSGAHTVCAPSSLFPPFRSIYIYF